MHFGIGRNCLISLIAILIFFSSACSQVKVKEENKMDKVQEYTDKAREFRIKGDSESALKEQLKAVELNPNDDDSLMLLGGIYIELKQYDKAVEVLQKSISLNSKNILAHHSLSIALGEVGRDREALEAIKKAVELDPNNHEFLAFLGANYEQVGERKLAIATFEKVLQINPDDIVGLYWLGSLEAEEGNIEKAKKLLEKAINMPISEENDKTYVDLCKEELLKLKNNTKNKKP